MTDIDAVLQAILLEFPSAEYEAMARKRPWRIFCTLAMRVGIKSHELSGFDAATAMRAYVLWAAFGAKTEERLRAAMIQAKEDRARTSKQRRAHALRKMTMRTLLVPNDRGRRGHYIAMRKDFYSTPEWKQLRYQVLERRGNFCECCGRSPHDGIVLHVDHIKPRSVFPELCLSEDNLQILCSDCNQAKSNQSAFLWDAGRLQRERTLQREMA